MFGEVTGVPSAAEQSDICEKCVLAGCDDRDPRCVLRPFMPRWWHNENPLRTGRKPTGRPKKQGKSDRAEYYRQYYRQNRDRILEAKRLARAVKKTDCQNESSCGIFVRG